MSGIYGSPGLGRCYLVLSSKMYAVNYHDIGDIGVHGGVDGRTYGRTDVRTFMTSWL